MEPDDIIARMVRLETALDLQSAELRREIKRVEERGRQELLSLTNDLTETSKLVVQVDTQLRGRDGANGLASRVAMLDAKLAVSDEHLGGRLDALSATGERHYVALRRYILGLVATITGAVVVRYLLGL